MKLLSAMSIITTLLSSCNPSKTVYISNKTGETITLLVDSSCQGTHPVTFDDSLNGLRIEKKKVLDFGEGKWSKEDKASLEELIKHTKIVKNGTETAVDMPHKTKVSHISFNVEELWVNIK